MSQIVYLNGSFVAKDEARLSPDDRGFVFSDGVYDVVRSYDGRPFELAAHLSRLEASLAGLRIRGVDPAALEPVCGELMERNGLTEGDATLYIQVTRGVAPRAHRFPSPDVTPTVYAAASRYVPHHDPGAGAAAITVPDRRWTRCDIKTVSLVANCLASQEAHEAGAYEAIFVRDGVALEGTHTNFFGVFGGVVCTAPLSNYILPGVTRRVVLELCREEGIPVEETPMQVEELRGADELFVTGTTTEVTALSRLDGEPVGDGAPGPVALGLLDLLRARATRT